MSSATELITPFLLTFNEADNVEHTLRSLAWAKRVVVVDSGSTDTTEAIARDFANVAWYVRKFDSFKGQSDYAIHETGIETPYVMALDADMSTSPALIRELEQRFLTGGFGGANIPFHYCVNGKPLLGSLLAPQLRLFRRDEVTVVQKGHGHKFAVKGSVYSCRSALLHDDRKPLERWMASQLGYAKAEEAYVLDAGNRGLAVRLRRAGVMPIVAGTLAYLRAGGPLGGAAARHYAFERVVFESLLAMRLHLRPRSR